MRVTVLAVVVMLWNKPSSEASDVSQCTGERRSDGHFFFNISHDFKEDSGDCETQWLVDGNLVGYCNAEGMKSESPIVSATRDIAILTVCPKKLECLIICPTANIHEKKQCSCEAATNTTTPSKEDSSNWSIGIWIGITVFAVSVFVIVTIVLYCRKVRSS